MATRRWFLAPLILLMTAGCVGQEPSVDVELRSEITKLKRDISALEQTIIAAEQGKLIGPGQLLLGIHERAATAVLTAALPIEAVIDGTVTVRIEKVTASFDGGFGTVTVTGRAWLVKRPKIATAFNVAGGFSEAIIDEATGNVRAQVGLDTLVAEPISGGWLESRIGRILLSWLNEKGRREIAALLSPLEIPLHLDRAVRVPDFVDDVVVIKGAVLPLHLAVARVIANHERLWIAIEPRFGDWQLSDASSTPPAAEKQP